MLRCLLYKELMSTEKLKNIEIKIKNSTKEIGHMEEKKYISKTSV